MIFVRARPVGDRPPPSAGPADGTFAEHDHVPVTRAVPRRRRRISAATGRSRTSSSSHAPRRRRLRGRAAAALGDDGDRRRLPVHAARHAAAAGDRAGVADASPSRGPTASRRRSRRGTARSRTRSSSAKGSLDYFHTHVCAPGAAGCTSALGSAKVTGTSTTPGQALGRRARARRRARGGSSSSAGSTDASSRRRSRCASRETRGILVAAARQPRSRCPAAALGARRAARDGPRRERRREHAAGVVALVLHRGGRAALRDRLGDRRGRPPADRGPAAPLRVEPGQARRAAAAARAQGWYLVFWRVISVDGHPVRGAFTFAVGPNPGPAPQFVIPSLSETAATPTLVAARWVVVPRAAWPRSGSSSCGTFIARPLVRAVAGRALRPSRSRSGVGARRRARRDPRLPAARDRPVRAALGVRRSARSFRCCARPRSAAAISTSSSSSRCSPSRPRSRCGSTGPSARSARSRSCSRSAARSSRPARRSSSPGLAGHAAQTSPRGLALALDWLHLAAGSLWVGGLSGCSCSGGARRPRGASPALAVCVPRFSNVAFVSVLALLGDRHRRVDPPPADARHAVADVVRQGDPPQVGSAARRDAPRRRQPRCAPSRGSRPPWRPRPRGAAVLLRRLVTGEVVLVAGAVVAAAACSRACRRRAKALADARQAQRATSARARRRES